MYSSTRLYSTSLHNIRFLFTDIEEVLREKKLFWLHASVLLYMALLPFNAYGITLFHRTFKFTEIALVFVMIFGLYAFWKKDIHLRRSWWLYFFLFLNILAQLFSVFNAPRQIDTSSVAFAVMRYSILVFLLVNVITSEKILRAILTVMGFMTILVVGITYGQRITYYFQGLDFYYGDHSVLGINVIHYMSYFLLLYGSGLAYLFIRGANLRPEKLILFFAALLWVQLVFSVAIKIAHILFFFFAGSLIFIIRGRRLRATALMGLCIALFVLRWYIVPITNSLILARYNIESRVMTTKNTIAASFDKVQQRFALLFSSSPPTPPSAPVAPTPSSPVSVLPTTPVILPPPPSSPVSVLPTTPVILPPPPSAPTPVLVGEYDSANRLQNRWIRQHKSESISIRQRGLAVGWLIGHAFPLTGVGAGQTRYYFDEFSKKVREGKRTGDLPWLENYIFSDEEISAANADKGIFNIFGNAWAETGGLGLFALIGILCSVFFSGGKALWHTMKLQGVQPIHILFPLFIVLIAYHQTIYLWVHPWLWTMIALTYVAAQHTRDTMDEKIL